jgi:uncharacterized protein (TIGR02391 family)
MANSELPRATISLSAIPLALQKLNRRLGELEGEKVLEEGKTDIPGLITLMTNKINATIDDVFGVGTAEAADFWVESSSFRGFSANWGDRVEAFNRGLKRARETVSAAIERLQEKAADAEEEASGRALRAYEGLELHPEIARAASNLYRDGHYANAVEASVKVLNGLVRLRSDLELDGTSLMEKAFNPSNPTLKFNQLSSPSDRDEQKGFMMMFSGAVSGLRNPRAHGFIHDDPERALEFIAFVSLLAKLLDEAKR